MSDTPSDLPISIKQDADNPAVYRVYDTIIGIDTPAPVADIADLALCSDSEARAVLEILHELRVVNKDAGGDDEPDKYSRNDEFFDWKRAATLADEFEYDELSELQRQLTAQIETFKDIYDVNAVEHITINTDHQGLRDHIRADAEQWALLEQTCEDIEFAKRLVSDRGEK